MYPILKDKQVEEASDVAIFVLKVALTWLLNRGCECELCCGFAGESSRLENSIRNKVTVF